MGLCLEKVQIPEGHSGKGNVNGRNLRYGMAAAQGRRPYMEDLFSLAFARQMDEGNEVGFFAIFDGHGGDRVAAFCVENMFKCFLRRFKASDKLSDLNDEDISDALTETFLEVDAEVAKLPPILVKETPGCLGGPKENLKDIEFVGSTASTVFLTGERIIFANCGDSRTILIKENDVAFCTLDHVPSNPEEVSRIENAGGYVESDRVNGILAVSRAIGDHRFKNNEDLPAEMQMVTAKPDVRVFDRDHEKDQFIIIASDGVFNVMNVEEMTNYALKFLLEDRIEADVFCEIILEECVNRRYSSDNVSVMVVDLQEGQVSKTKVGLAFEGMNRNSTAKEE